jgi:hypothetical protein
MRFSIKQKGEFEVFQQLPLPLAAAVASKKQSK